jgi:hypothetical protein
MSTRTCDGPTGSQTVLTAQNDQVLRDEQFAELLVACRSGVTGYRG